MRSAAPLVLPYGMKLSPSYPRPPYDAAGAAGALEASSSSARDATTSSDGGGLTTPTAFLPLRAAFLDAAQRVEARESGRARGAASAMAVRMRDVVEARSAAEISDKEAPYPRNACPFAFRERDETRH